ncbi:aminopeptidase [Aristaeella hokkaidonensis]|uniref:Aminopeptidase n=1 Tax=Aristaeella hokkaidonensis TaxID=3046382 RepID=A0AC61MWV2_9FIRM|nr:aminopeptidase [Aristaeella hokkaidonensis]QUC65983.1 aminopeptidase [Aristaeella hokkaidonensis]SNT93794.1 aminopeptidase [Aristaeella hokkaidonensis]
MKQTVLRNYAKLIARMGVNIQKGQEVIIYCELDQPRFVEMLVDECYKAGAGRVRVEFGHQPLYKLNVRHRSVTSLAKVEEWEKVRLQHYVDTLPASITLISADPDGLKGINQAKVAKADQKSWPIYKPYFDAMENKYQWCIAAVPGAAWAKKVFPGLPKGRAIEKLWEAILFTSRATEDPIAAWETHNKDLHDRCVFLNNLGIAELRYRGDNGTNLTVGLIPEGTFTGGVDTTIGGVPFDANIPSEECYTSPMRGKAEGIVYATKPLSYNGQLIENFWVRFENGKAVEVHAEKNQALLEQMISMDEGAAYLGECALVPVNSPISESGILFYETLFDENAACHLALGMGFTNTIRGFENKTVDECREMGINDSMEHNDFMIGYEGLDIDAVTRDGKTVPIFRRGKWAFDV